MQLHPQATQDQSVFQYPLQFKQVKIEAKTVNDYLEKIPEDRKKAIEEVRKVVLANLPEGYEEVIQYNMISYVIPLQRYPTTYNKQPLALLSIGSQKNHMALYMNNVYSDEVLRDWFLEAYKATGKRLDMGKSCVRFRKLENLPLEVIGEAVSRTSVERMIELYEKAKGIK